MSSKLLSRTTLRTAFLPIFFVAIQWIAIPLLWSQQSDQGVLFGRYSARYALVLAANLILIALSLAIWVRYKRVQAWVQTLPQRLIAAVLFGIPLLLLALGLIPLEPQVRQYFALNLVLAGSLIAAARRAPISLQRTWIRLFWLALMALVILMALSTLVTFPFSPDEAHWADYASTAFLGGGVYARMWMMTPQLISPGIGWGVAAYGWTLEHIAFDIRVGRLWNLAGDALAFGGIFALAHSLYGRRTAWLTLAFALLSQVFIPVFDYRPSHLIALASAWAGFALVQSMRATDGRSRWVWSAVSGLIVTLSLQLHAIGIALIFGWALFYLGNVLLSVYTTRRIQKDAVSRLLAFALGALLGSAIYFVFNILPAGGLMAFLSTLVEERSERLSILSFLKSPSIFEAAWVLAAYLFLLWRRRSVDRWLLGLTACLIISLVIVDTQGYFAPIAPLYAVAVGTFFSARPFGWRAGRRVSYCLALVAVALAGLALVSVNWPGLSIWERTGNAPDYFYHELRDRLANDVRSDDVIAGSHLLIWTFPDSLTLYSYAGENNATTRWGLADTAEVWRRIAPDVIIDIEREMILTEGMQTYLRQQQFTACTQFELDGRDVTVYRADCESESG